MSFSEEYRKAIEDNNETKRLHKEEHDHKVQQGETTEEYVPLETEFDKAVRYHLLSFLSVFFYLSVLIYVFP